MRKLYNALNERRLTEDLSWRALARELDLSGSSMSRMSKGLRPDADTLCCVIAWLGQPLRHFIVEAHPKSLRYREANLNYREVGEHP